MGSSRPDSIASRVERIVKEQSVARSEGVTAREVLDVYWVAFGPVAMNVVSNALSVLVHKGKLLKCGGRLLTTCYAHSDSPQPAKPDPVAEAAVRIVRREARKHGSALRTSDVAEFLGAEGVAFGSVDNLRTVLTSLAYISPTKRARSHSAWAEPLIVKVEHRTTGNRVRAYWSFPGGPNTPPAVSDNYDAARLAVTAAEAALGRPPSKRELVAWATAASGGGGGDLKVADTVLTSGFAARLSGCAARDATRPDEHLLRYVRTHLTSRGAYPVRYTLGAVTGEKLDACVVEDLSRQLTPADELEAIRDLRVFATEVDEPSLLHLVAVREALLHRESLRCFGEDAGALQRLRAAVRTCEQASTVLLEWADYVGGFPHERQDARDAVMANAEQTAALLRAAELTPSAAVPSAASIASYPGVPVAVLQELAEEALALNQRETNHWEQLLAPARRVRGAKAGGVSASVPEDMRAALDRPDAMTLLVGVCALPRTSALLTAAEHLMGRVLRDSDLLLQLLLSHPVAEVRDALTVALGMLGRVPPLEAACPDPASYDSACAYSTAVALGVDDFDERIGLAEAADNRARGSAARVTEAALVQFESGARLGALE